MSIYTKRSSTRRSDDTMDEDGDDKDDTKRKSRNLSEKKRRDQFNLLVNELSSMVSTGNRKMDKSTVLRSTISFLKNHNEIAIRSRVHEIQEDWKPTFLSNEEFTHLILEAVDGFIIVFSSSGYVHYVSESITSLLGYLPNDLLHTSIYELVWNEEQTNLYQSLMRSGDGQFSFQVHLRRGSLHPPGVEADCYEFINFVGYLRMDDTLDTITTESGEVDTRLFVGTGRLRTPQLIREMSLLDAASVTPITTGSHSGRSAAGEFTSRHSLEWKFLFLDHRAPPIIGYLPFEVLGTSGYDYYHVDDLDKVVSCHEALMQKGEGTSCYYRFLTKGQQWIWLQTRFYITYHQWNSKPEFIVCTHQVVSYMDVMKQTQKMPNEPPTSNTIPVDSSPVPTSTPGSETPSPWGSQRGSRHRRRGAGPPSDCTSMSADSPASRQSQSQSVQQHNCGRTSRMSSHSHGAVSGSAVPPTGLISAPSTTTIFGEPVQQPLPSSQFVTAMPFQSAVITSFPTPPATVLPQIPPTTVIQQQTVESNDIVQDSSGANNGPNNNHLQAQLQRKHAELQAIIGQQQAELRRVSEQLLMARLGLLPQESATANQNLLYPQVSMPYPCNSNVSSTTTAPSLCSRPGETAPPSDLLFSTTNDPSQHQN